MPGEGYIKFNIDWHNKPFDFPENLNSLNECRSRLFTKKLIGMYDNGIGYGNISMRTDNCRFIISGSSTGNIQKLARSHYSLVEEFSIEKNSIKCCGPVRASSESLTHAAVYKTLPDVNCVIHIHNSEIWEKYRCILPTSCPEAEYGTPEMAEAIMKIIKQNNMKSSGTLIMGGHPEGIIVFADTVENTELHLYNSLGITN